MSIPRQRMESKRTTRWQVVREVEEKVERVRKATEDNMHDGPGEGKGMRGRWFTKYAENRAKTWNAHVLLLEEELAQHRNWRVKAWDRQLEPVLVKKPLAMDEWRRNVWPRNFYCELCMGVAGPGADVLDCRTCNVVMHFRCVTARFGPYQMGAREWQCEFCRRTREREELEYAEEMARAKATTTRFNMAIKIQACMRAWIERWRYRQFLLRLSASQALVRMWLQRRSFRQMMNSYVRLYKIKALDIVDMVPLEADVHASTFVLVVSVVNRKHRQAELQYIDPGQQRYRFETTSFHYGTHVRLNQQFLVPGSTNQVLLAFTLIRKEGVRNEFWGQAVVDGASVLDTKRNKLRINLGDLKFEPRDRKNIVPLKNRMEPGQITGVLTAEILPLSSCVSKCSLIHEVPEVEKEDSRGGLRQWWACLVDQSLLLFKKYGDSLPYRSITILRVSWFNRVSIRVSSLRGDEALIFTCADPEVRSDWFFKLKAMTERAAAADK